MEILAILWCESQSAQQRLRKTFRQSDSSIETQNVNLESEYENADWCLTLG